MAAYSDVPWTLKNDRYCSKQYLERAWHAFWLNTNETQLWKFIGKNRNPILLASALFFSFLGLEVCETDL